MMSTMLFMLLALAMCLCIAAVFIWFLIRQRPVRTSASQAKLNASVYRAQISDLDFEHQSGHISAQEWQQTRDELSQRLLEDTSVGDDPGARKEKPALWTALLIGLTLPVASLSMYLWVGEPQALQAMATVPPEKAMQAELSGMAQTLAKKLESNPDNQEGWVMLGRSYRTLEKYDNAVSAYDRALKLSADDGVKLERAEVLALKAQGNFDGEPWNVIREILKKIRSKRALCYWPAAPPMRTTNTPMRCVTGSKLASCLLQTTLMYPVWKALSPPLKTNLVCL